MLTFKEKTRINFSKTSFRKETLYKGNIIDVYTKQTNNPTKRVGQIEMGLCPFHQEDSPSFALYEESNTAHCYGCGWSGDTIKFIMETHNVDFKEALRIIKEL